MITRLEKLTIRDTFKQWRDKINLMTDRMDSAIYADRDGKIIIGPDECNASEFIVKVPSEFTGEVQFHNTDNTGSYESSITANDPSNTINAGLVLTGESDTGDYIPWISGKTANGHITQYTTKENDNLYFTYVDEDGTVTQLFYWNNETNRIEGLISNAVLADRATNADKADKIKSTSTNSNSSFKISFGKSSGGYATIYEDADLTYNPSTNTLKAGNFDGNLSGNAQTATSLETPRTITLDGDASGSALFDGTEDVTINVTINNTGVRATSYGQPNSIAQANFGDTISIPYYTVNEKGQITSSKTSTIKLPENTLDELVYQTSSLAENDFPILAGAVSNPQTNGARKSIFNNDITIYPKTGTLKTKNAIVSSTLTANTVNCTTLNASDIKITVNGQTVPFDNGVVHITGAEKITGTKTFTTSTVWTNSNEDHKIGMTVNATTGRGGIYDWTNSKWVVLAEADGSVTRFLGSADKLTTARKLGVNLGVSFTNANSNTATFDASSNQLEIPVKGILDISNGGTGATTAEDALVNLGINATATELNTLVGISTSTSVQAQLDLKAPKASPTFTGSPTLSGGVTSANKNNNTLATTKFVNDTIAEKIELAMAANDSMIYKGTVASSSDLPAQHTAGWTYKASAAFTIGTKTVEKGDMIICNTTGTTANNAHWDIIEGNIDNALTNNSTTHVNGGVVVYVGTSGNAVKDSGFTIGKSVPANAVFTDTTYDAATTNTLGLVKVPTANGLSVGTGTNKGLLSVTQASTSAYGTVKVGSNITVSGGVISVGNASTTAKGVVQVSTSGNGLKSSSGVLDVNTATKSRYGTVKVGSNITVSSDGIISISSSDIVSALGYTPIQTAAQGGPTYNVFGKSGPNASSGLVPSPSTTAGTTKYLREDGYWMVPPDTNTTYGAATTNTLGLVKIAAAATSNITNNSGSISITKANIQNAVGNASTSANGLMTAAMVTKLNSITTGANAYTHPDTPGNKHVPSGGSSGQILRWSANGTAVWGADNNTTYGNASTAGSGLMTAAMVTKLNGIAAGANAYTHPTHTANTGNPTANQTPAFGGTFTVNQVTNNNLGHVTAQKAYTIKIPNTAASTTAPGLMTAAMVTKLNGIATGANAYVHPTTAGNKHIPAGGAAGQTLIWSAAGTAVWGRKVTFSTATASGGSNGDIWYQYM